MRFFNLNDPSNILQKRYANYGKASGLLLAHSLGLPVSTNGWIYDSHLGEEDYTDIATPKYRFLCRPDAPMGYGNDIPRGRDLYYEEISSFYELIRKICDKAIVLAFPPPSIQFTGKYVPRYQILGGLMTVIDNVRRELLIEYVGRGFDVGDITRGKHIHTSISIPIKELNEEISHLFMLNKKEIIGRRYDITHEQYNLSRFSRIDELSTKLAESDDDIAQCIPKERQVLQLSVFRKLLNECVFPVLYSSQSASLGKIFGIMINIYKTGFYVFELWQPTRNIPI